MREVFMAQFQTVSSSISYLLYCVFLAQRSLHSLVLYSTTSTCTRPITFKRAMCSSGPP